MATVRLEFDAYKIFYYSQFGYEALVYLYREGDFVGRLVFDKEPVRANRDFASGSGPSVHFAISRFNDVMSILREEKPLYLFFNRTSLIGILGTDELEPVGEEEG